MAIYIDRPPRPPRTVSKSRVLKPRRVLLAFAIVVLLAIYWRYRSPSPFTSPPTSQQEIKTTLQLASQYCPTPDSLSQWNCSTQWKWYKSHQYWSPSYDTGRLVYDATSKINGAIQVTAHSAVPSLPTTSSSSSSSSPNNHLAEEWRVMRFNGNDAMISVNRLVIDTSNKNATVTVLTQCQGFDYIKQLTTLLTTRLGQLQDPLSLEDKAIWRFKMLITGLGGGSMPILFSRHFPLAQIDVVEIDEEVVKAAHEAMGFPYDLPNVRVIVDDAAEYLKKFTSTSQQSAFFQLQSLSLYTKSESAKFYDFIFLDAYDAEVKLPDSLQGDKFAVLVAKALHPDYGTLFMNFIPEDSTPATEQRFKNAVVTNNSKNQTGFCYHIQARAFPNIAAVCARGVDMPDSDEEVKVELRKATERVAGLTQFCVDVMTWATENYVRI